MTDANTTDLKLYLYVHVSFKLYLHLSTMPNPKGNPENLKPLKSDREEPLTQNLNFRVTEKMKEEVKAQDDPPEFCREAIQKALDEKKGK
ncbi:CopG family transcriptional regulator [Nostoc sp. DSM 114160]